MIKSGLTLDEAWDCANKSPCLHRYGSKTWFRVVQKAFELTRYGKKGSTMGPGWRQTAFGSDFTVQLSNDGTYEVTEGEGL